jgi:drug/metabolite transporter (DMT)-like permease
MFQQFVHFLNGIPFFSSVAFGIIAMVIVGSSWCLTGLVMGDAPKKGIESSLVQFCGSFVSCAFSVIILLATAAYSTSTPKVTFLTCLTYFLGGTVNCIMLQLMSKAMQVGPNGIIWAIIQSALIFPFLGGIVFFDVKLTALRGTGIVLMLVALALFAMTKDNTGKFDSRKWKLLTFAALVLTALQQNIATLPAYFQEARGVTSIIRSLSTASGTMFGAVCWNLAQMNRQYWQNLKNSLKRWTLWKYIMALQGFSLVFAYTLFYPGMNVMADAGMGGMCYPMMVGSCIVTFTLTSIWLLKEKTTRLQIIALVFCLSGLVLICTQ